MNTISQSISAMNQLCSQLAASEAENAKLLAQLEQREKLAAQQLSQLQQMISQLSAQAPVS